MNEAPTGEEILGGVMDASYDKEGEFMRAQVDVPFDDPEPAVIGFELEKVLGEGGAVDWTQTALQVLLEDICKRGTNSANCTALQQILMVEKQLEGRRNHQGGHGIADREEELAGALRSLGGR